MMSRMCEKMNKLVKPQKVSLFKGLDVEAKAAGKHKFKVLEIGGGSGNNFEFLATPVDWTVTEPNLSFESYFKSNVQKLGGDHKINDLIEATNYPRAPGFGAHAQEALSRSGVWLAIADGCVSNRDTEEAVRRAGFASCEVTNYRAKGVDVYLAATQMYGRGTK